MNAKRDDPAKHAVVLSGGGADGAYEVGALKALFEGKSPATRYRPLEPEIFCGSSIGSFNATFLVAKWDQLGTAAIDDLESCWLDRLAEGDDGNGAYRLRANPLDIADPRSYVPNPLEPPFQLAIDSVTLAWDGTKKLAHLLGSREEQSLAERIVELFDFAAFVSPRPWYQTLEDTIDYEAVRSSSRKLRIATTNWDTGKLKIFENSDMTEKKGRDVVAASSALPGFYPPVRIGSADFIDGGVVMNTPLVPAIHAGADVLHIIYLDPDIASIPIDRVRNSLGTLYRTQQITWASILERDIASAGRINRVVRATSAAQLGRRADAALEELRQTHADLRLLEIHRYVPEEEESGPLGLLDLSRSRLEKLIDKGFDNAASHSCEKEGCVLLAGKES